MMGKTTKFVSMLLLVTVLVGCQHLDGMATLTSDSKSGEVTSPYDELFDANKFSEIITLYETNVSNNVPTADRDVLIVAQSYRRLNSFGKAMPLFVKLFKEQKFTNESLEAIGLIYVAQGDFAKGRELLEQVINNDAARWKAINGLAVIAVAQEDNNLAMQYFETALALEPDNKSIKFNLALIYVLDEQYELAIEYLNDVLIESKNLSKQRKLANALAMIHGQLGDYETAKDVLGPYFSQAEVFNNLGVYAQLANDKYLARTYFSKALSGSSKHYQRAWDNMQKVRNSVK